MEYDCGNNKTKKTRRVGDLKLTAPWLRDLT